MHILMVTAAIIAITVTVIAVLIGLFLLLTSGNGRGE